MALRRHFDVYKHGVSRKRMLSVPLTPTKVLSTNLQSYWYSCLLVAHFFSTCMGPS